MINMATSSSLLIIGLLLGNREEIVQVFEEKMPAEGK